VFACTFKIFHFANLGADLYKCDSLIHILADYPASLLIQGDHLSGKTNAHIEALTMRDSKLFYSIPADLGNYIPNLRSLEISYTNLSSVSRNVLSQFPYLNIITLAYNNFATLDGNLFASNRQLRYLNIIFNNVKHIGANMLKDLIYLQTVYIAEGCVDVYANTPSEIQQLNDKLHILCP
jgi:hypothetical protein